MATADLSASSGEDRSTDPSKVSATRRSFLALTAGTGVLTSANALRAAQSGNPSRTNGVNPFTDPSYAAGAKMRMQEFVGRGADPKEVAAIFERLTTLDAEPWVAEWTKLAVPFEHKAAELESQGKIEDANKAYLKAASYYGIAKFPCINHPAKQAAYRKAIENYLKGTRTQDPPRERVAIPFEGKEIIGYLRKPKGIALPPVIIGTGGVDVYKEERNTDEIVKAGVASFSMDMPGAGECAVFNTPNAERLYTTTIDYLLTRQDLDGQRMGFIGRSYAGYWGAKMAYVESKRLRACVQAGGPIHYTFQEPWLRGLLNEKEYFWSILDSMIYSNGVKNFDELLKTAPAMSLKEQGWLDKPCAPMFAYNGALDPWMSPQEIPLLLETGEPKTARIIADGKHLGRGSKENGRVGRMATDWLIARVKA
jgi:hypothetical protein